MWPAWLDTKATCISYSSWQLVMKGSRRWGKVKTCDSLIDMWPPCLLSLFWTSVSKHVIWSWLALDQKLFSSWNKLNFVKGELINMTWAWDKENIWVPDRNRTDDLPNTGWAPCPLSYENSWRAKSLTEFICDKCPAYSLGSVLLKSSGVVIN